MLAVACASRGRPGGVVSARSQQGRRVGGRVCHVARGMSGRQRGFDTKMPPGFFRVGSLDDLSEKQTKAVILANDNAYVLALVASRVYVVSANSTAYKFPLNDAVVGTDTSGNPFIQSPLDGTIYSLTTGEVLEWCPRDNPLRMVLGALKAKENPKPLPTYPVRVDNEGGIFMSEDQSLE